MEEREIAGMRVKIYAKGEWEALYPEQAKLEAERDERWRQQRERAPRESEPLACDKCGAHLGWVYECDLNGSYFYCDKCRGEALNGPNTGREVQILQSLDEKLS